MGLALVACKPAVSPGVAVFESFRYEGRDAVYPAHPLSGKDVVYNPILPGWYSDPSICSNGEGDYFLVTSTFSYFPGVPLFHSRDLVNWKQVGHVLDRPSQLTGLGRQHTSGGIYAPDIKYNPKNRTYYMITTNVGTGNFLVKTQDPFGAWSDPILLPQVQGIDPSLFFDDDGKAYIVNNDEAPGGKPEYDGHRTIRIVEYDVENDCTIGERRIIVNKGVDPAAKPIWIEGPHLYKIDGKYFLMCAEGGTSDQHSEAAGGPSGSGDLHGPCGPGEDPGWGLVGRFPGLPAHEERLREPGPGDVPDARPLVGRRLPVLPGRGGDGAPHRPPSRRPGGREPDLRQLRGGGLV